MSKKRISALEWESKVNTISLSKQHQKHLDILNSDSIQTILDNERETNEIDSIKQKYDRAYYARSNKR